MTEERAKRKLTAILSADVKGYSRLMGEDELSTVETLKKYRGIISSLVQQYSGRVVDSPGDNILAEFPSVVDAVECAVKIQKELKAKNAELPENRRMEFRIGVNLGDVIDDEGRIYGDGVNVASRVEGLAEGGGICISGTAFDQIGKKLPLGYEYMGEQEVKNIEEPVRVYKVMTEPEYAGKVSSEKELKPKQRLWAALAIGFIVVVGALAIWNSYFRPPSIEPASVEKMAFPLPEKPSIAVLPFDNMSGDPDREYIADGISENIISALSHIPEMFVIARNSTFTYKGKPVKIQEVSEELGVRYVLEGSIRTSGDQMRVTAQLIDATTGHHLWSERYDRDLKDLFALQDEITLRILGALQVKLTEGEQARLWSTTDNLEAWSKLIKGSSLFEQYTRQNNARAQQLFEQAAKLDPSWDIAWTMLAWTHWFEARFGWSESPAESIRRAVEIARKAAAINPNLPEVHSLQSNIYLLQGDYEKAVIEGKKAVALGPNSAICHLLLGYTMVCVGKFEEAIGLAEKAIRLSPYSSPWYLLVLDDAYRMAGRYEEALAVGKQYLERCQREQCNPFPGHLGLAATYIGLGRTKEAQAHVAQLLKIDPNFSVDSARKMVSFKDPAHLERALDALRQAGLPETPPLPLPDKPSIAVLPFENMSGDPDQEYFVDGMTDDLITDLCKISGLFVIARNSVFQYKGKPADVKIIGRELGVRYVLEGSVRRAKDQVRINAQLIDATTGGHLWAERYDDKLIDVFSLQDKITRKIVTALAMKLTAGEEAHIAHKETNNIAAYDLFLQGWAHYLRCTPDNYGKAVYYFEKAVKLDPHYGRAHAALASIYWESFYRFWHSSLRVSWGETKERADKHLQTAMKSPTPLAYLVASKMLIASNEHGKAIAKAEQAIAVDPSDPYSYIAMAYALNYAGRPQEALRFIKKAMRLDPHYPASYLFVLGLAHFGMDRFEESATSFERALSRNPENYVSLIPLAAAYAHLNREQEAKAAIETLRKALPAVTISFVRGCPLWKYRNAKDKCRLLDGLKKAGLTKSIYETLRKSG